MSNSADSLKKKVCVTVFLDELFEEIEEEREETQPKQVSCIAESLTKAREKPLKEPPRLGNDEKVTVYPDAYHEGYPRPRKPRKESKFSKNRYHSFKNELTKYGYNPHTKTENENREDSVISDSDFDLDEFLGLGKWAREKSRSSFTEATEHDLSDQSFRNINPGGASKVSKRRSENRPPRGDDGTVKEIQEGEIVTWKETQKQIQMILAEARSRYQEKETCQGDRIRYYDLRSILEECVQPDRRRQLEYIHPQNESGPSAIVCNEGSSGTTGKEICQVQNANKNEVGVIPLKTDSLLCYTLSLKCKEEKEKLQSGKSIVKPNSSKKTKKKQPVKPRSSREGEVVFKAVAKLADQTILETVVTAEHDARDGKKGTSHQKGKTASANDRSKNFAEGDTARKSSSLNRDQKVLVCDDILNHVGEPKDLRNEIIVNRAEIELLPQGEQKAGVDVAAAVSEATPDVIAEVFFNQKQTESTDKNITDVESEMIFAESENYGESDEFVGEKPSLNSLQKSFQSGVCVLEFEDKLSRSKILRRMKTVEILGDSSLNDMRNISTEVILICENLSSNEVCMEAWQSSASTLRSLSKMKQCYLKDSNDSSMYLIEIPLHFTREKKNPASDSEYVFKGHNISE